jgi:hypothetical protein
VTLFLPGYMLVLGDSKGEGGKWKKRCEILELRGRLLLHRESVYARRSNA